MDEDDKGGWISGGPSFVAVVQSAYLWQRHDRSHFWRLNGLACVMRKNSPQFKQLVDEFVQSHAVGTSFGSTLLRRYLQNTKWVKNSTSAEDMKNFQANLILFQKYAGAYNFDCLMIAAQRYQESLLDQSKKNPSGAVGIMQVIPKNAAASPISVPAVATSDGNIHAGVKMLRNIADTYFNDSKHRSHK